MVESAVATYYGVAGTLLLLSLISVILRLYVRLRMIKAFGLDDYLMVLAWIIFATDQAFIFRAIDVGAGKSLKEFLDNFSGFFRVLYFGIVLYTPSIWILKLSVATFLFRLVQARSHKIVLCVTTATFSLYSIGYIIFLVLQCTPVDYYWNRLTKEGKCVSTESFMILAYIHSAIIAASDIVFACVPIAMVWNLNMNRAMKVSVASLLGLGTLGGITTFIRIPYLKELEHGNALTFITSMSNLMIWSCIEPGLGIIVGSMATLRPLFRRYLGDKFTFRSSISSHPSHPSRKSTQRMSQATRNSRINSTSKCITVTVQDEEHTEPETFPAFDSQDDLNGFNFFESRVVESRQTNEYDDEDFEMGYRASVDHRGLSPMPPRKDWQYTPKQSNLR